MSSVNKVILVGRVGKDPEVRHLDGGKSVAKFSVATSETYKDKSGNKQESTEWHNIEVWGDLAKVAESYVKKGDMLYIEGSIKTDSWEDNGVKKYATKIRCNSLIMLGGKPKAEEPKEEEAQVPVNGKDETLPF